MEGIIILLVSFALIAWLSKIFKANSRSLGYTRVRSYKRKNGSFVRSHLRRKWD